MVMQVICSAICSCEELATSIDLDGAKRRFASAEAAYLADPLSQEKFYGFIRETMGYYLIARNLGQSVGRQLQESLLRSECLRAEVTETVTLEALDVDPLSTELRQTLTRAAEAYDKAFTAWENFLSETELAIAFDGYEDAEAAREWQDRMVDVVEPENVVDSDPWMDDRALIVAAEQSDAQASFESNQW